MKVSRCFALVGLWAALAAVTPFILSGCGNASRREKSGEEAKPLTQEGKEIQAARAKLSPEDRKLVEAQEFCPITEKRLGSMGTPPKVLVQGQPVFLCCAACEEEALENPERTLAKVEELTRKEGAR